MRGDSADGIKKLSIATQTERSRHLFSGALPAPTEPPLSHRTVAIVKPKDPQEMLLWCRITCYEL